MVCIYLNLEIGQFIPIVVVESESHHHYHYHHHHHHYYHHYGSQGLDSNCNVHPESSASHISDIDSKSLKGNPYSAQGAWEQSVGYSNRPECDLKEVSEPKGGWEIGRAHV